MEYVYAALILNESGTEINEQNLTNVLEAANVNVEESRVKALVAALEDIDIEDAVEQATAVPAGGSTAPATPEAELEEPDEPIEGVTDEDEGEDEKAEADADDGGDGDGDDDEGDGGEGLGQLFG